ncbi:MAG: hypothetical protein K2R98_16085 [Gemmataceae bacterium]|nr:hypothetical protein [Gemmataceae bacterium]
MGRAVLGNARAAVGRLMLAAAIALVASSSATAQPVKQAPFGEGSHCFRAILNKMELKPILSEAEFRKEARDNPDRVIVIVLGKTGFLNRVPDGLETFLTRGGAVMVASDQAGGQWEEVFDARITGTFVRVSAESPSAYRESPDCPFIQPLQNQRIPVFTGLDQVATNRPSFLSMGSASPLTTLALFPTDCEIPNVPAELLNRLRFAAGGSFGKGRALLLADHSVFINDMLLQTDNDNFDMTCNAVRWLSSAGQRNRVLFVEEGEVVTNFNVVLKEPPLPPLPSEADLIRIMNRTLVGLEDENFFNRQILKHLPPPAERNGKAPDYRPSKAPIHHWLILLGTAAIVGFGWLRLSKSRHKIDPRMPLMQPSVWETPTVPVIDQRHLAMLHSGNLGDAARDLARQFFEAVLGFRPAEWGQGGSVKAPNAPEITVSDPAKRRALTKQVLELWRMACAVAPPRVTPLYFEQLSNQATALRAELSQGTLKIIGERGIRKTTKN